MKYVLIGILVLALSMSLFACGNNNGSDGEASATEAGETTIKLRWYGVCAFELDINGHHIVTDPYITRNQRNKGLNAKAINDCETVLISHGHYDHIMDLPEVVSTFSPRILAGTLTADPLAEYCNAIPQDVYPMNPGLELDFGDYKVKAMFSRHTKTKNRAYDKAEEAIDGWELLKEEPSECFRTLQTLGNIEYTNYIITAGSKKIVVFGGQPTVEQANMYKGLQPDLALVQMYGQDVNQVAALLKSMAAKNVVPAHLDTSATRDEYAAYIAELQELLKDDGITVTEPMYNLEMKF